MKKLISFALLLTGTTCSAQNLIPNGDFETHTNCPSSDNQLFLATPWLNLTIGSPDYLNVCATAVHMGVPENSTGYQVAHSGNGYAGIFASQIASAPNVREYLSILITQPLQSGQTYLLQFYVSLANKSQYAVTTLGAYFANNTLLSMSGWLANVNAQILNSTLVLTDTLNWQLISGTYTASGGEQYVTIGNFKDDVNCGIQPVNGGMAYFSYYYIDDVSLTNVTSVSDLNVNNTVKIYPNPFSDRIDITVTGNERSEIIVYDISSRKIIQQTFTHSSTLSTASLANGIYTYAVFNKSGILRKGKILKD